MTKLESPMKLCLMFYRFSIPLLNIRYRFLFLCVRYYEKQKVLNDKLNFKLTQLDVINLNTIYFVFTNHEKHYRNDCDKNCFVLLKSYL